MQQMTAIQQKLTNWSNEPKLGDLKQDVLSAKPTHDAQMLKIDGWNDLLKVTGSARPKKVKGRSSVQPKLIRRQAEWRYSALTEPFLSSHMLYSVKPKTFEDGKGARQNQIVLNHQFRTKLNRVQLIDNYVRANVDEGTAILRTGWCRKTVKVKEQVPVFDHLEIETEEQLNTLREALELKTADPRTYDENVPAELKAAVDYYLETDQASVAVQSGTETVEVEKIIENHPTVEVMNPKNVTIDPSCGGDINKALFVAVSFETNKAALKAEGKRYKNLDAVNWEGAAPINDPDHATTTPQDFQFTDQLRKKVVATEYWGYWDLTGTGMLEPIVCTWIGDVIIRLERNPYPDQKLPFVLVPYLPIKRELYGETDAELLEDNQRVLGALMRGMVDLLGRSANAQQGFAKGMLDPLNRRRYESGQDYEFNPNLTPAAGLIQHKYPELPQSALMMLNLQNQDAEALSGVKSFSGGISGSAYGEVAAGIRGALDAASKREMAILRRLAKGMAELGQKIISMNAVFLSEEEVIRITNEEFVTIKREDLKGNFDLEVDISTAEVDNAQAQDLAFMLQTMGNTVDQSITMMILAEICRLKRMPELENKLKNFKPQPDPLQQRMREAEVAKAELEVDELRAKISKLEAEASRARAEAEDKDISTIRKATGIEAAETRDNQQSQAQGNKELEIVKSLVKPRKEGEAEPELEAAIGYSQLTDAKSPVMEDSL